jgi:hypothetical protein
MRILILLIFHKFGLLICKLMRIQLITLMRLRNRIHSTASGVRVHHITALISQIRNFPAVLRMDRHNFSGSISTKYNAKLNFFPENLTLGIVEKIENYGTYCMTLTRKGAVL